MKSIFKVKLFNHGFKGYLKELSIVILGILIAFWLSNLGNKYHERKAQAKVLHTILNELKENNANIKTTIASLDTLFLIFSRKSKSDIFTDDINISYIGLSFRSVGYETAKYRGVLNDLDYELTSQIVENYEFQFSLENSEQLIVDELFKLIRNRTTKANEIDYLLLHISQLINRLNNFDENQKHLINELTTFLNLNEVKH
ncbi:MAG: hypothetical protein K9G61_09795 [Bacteroidales bacterium]|nr:hypothetical protein [Bacteroidales bacterium]